MIVRIIEKIFVNFSIKIDKSRVVEVDISLLCRRANLKFDYSNILVHR